MGLKARGVANKILSISPWSWSIFAISLAAFNSCVEPRILKSVFAGMSCVLSRVVVGGALAREQFAEWLDVSRGVVLVGFHQFDYYVKHLRR